MLEKILLVSRKGKKLKKLYLIRHAHTRDNELKRYSGYHDTSLSETGKKQARELCEFLEKNIKVDKIYVSKLRRTEDTIFDYIAYTGLEAKKLEGLNEMDFGDFDALTLEEIEKKYPEKYAEFMEGKKLFRFPNGENLQEAYNRNIKAFKEIVQEAKEDDNVMICAHMGTVRNIISYLLTDSYKLHWNIKIENATLTVIEFLGTYPILKTMGYVAYDFKLLRPHIIKKVRKEE